MMCDIIIASESAKFGQPEIMLGVIPGEVQDPLVNRINLAYAQSPGMKLILPEFLAIIFLCCLLIFFLFPFCLLFLLLRLRRHPAVDQGNWEGKGDCLLIYFSLDITEFI